VSFLRGFSFNLVGTALGFALGFAIQVLLARRLGALEYGPYGVLSTTVLLGALALGEWLNRGSTYAVGRGAARQKAAGNALLYGLALGLLLLMATGLAAWLLRPFLSEFHLVRWLLVAALVGVVVAQKAGQAVLLGEDRLQLYAALTLLMMVLYLAGAVLVLEVWDGGLEHVLAAWLAAYGVALVATFAALAQGGVALSFSGPVFRQSFGVGARGAVSVVLIMLLFRADLYLIDYFLDDFALGTYRTAANFAEMMQQLPNIAGLVLLPKVIRGQDEDARLSLKVAQGVLLFSLVAAAGLVLLGRFLIGFFFPLFAGAYAPLMWMLPGLVLCGYGSVLNTKLAGLGYPLVTLWAPALALGLNLGLDLWLIPRWGLNGAALATSLAYGLWALIATAYYLRHTGLKGRDLFHPAVALPR
jgi:O-antigen/teichoic acid export membrane protein